MTRHPRHARSLRRAAACALLLCTALATGPQAQPVFRGGEILPPEEFAARRLRVMAAIGDAVAVVRGTTEPAGEMPFRQNTQFFYLSGVAEPRASLIIDGRSKRATLFLLPKNESRERRNYGPALSPGPDAARETGIDDVRPAMAFSDAVAAIAAEGRVVYTPHGAEVLGSHDSHDGDRLREPLGLRAHRDPRHRAHDGRARLERRAVDGRIPAAPPGTL